MYLDNLAPATGRVTSRIARSDQKDVQHAADAAIEAAKTWHAKNDYEGMKYFLSEAFNRTKHGDGQRLTDKQTNGQTED